jgi:hypothetical protein
VDGARSVAITSAHNKDKKIRDKILAMEAFLAKVHIKWSSRKRLLEDNLAKDARTISTLVKSKKGIAKAVNLIIIKDISFEF